MIMRTAQIGITILVLLAFCLCTSNPFGGGDEISQGHREMRGTVELYDRADHEGIYVWLEGMEVGTKTDSRGDFVLELPASSPNMSLSGVFDLYFYMANYTIDQASVVIRDGEFVYDTADLDREGTLNRLRRLRKFLDIETTVEPCSVKIDYSQNLQVNVSLLAPVDTCTVILRHSVGGSLGAAFIRENVFGQVHIYQPYEVETHEKLLIGRTRRTITMPISLVTKPLPPGVYEVIPYILIRHQPIPDGLMESLGTQVEKLTPEYLNIPFQREGGRLVIYK